MYSETEPYYNTPTCRDDDIVCVGSDCEQTQEETRVKHLRYEEHATRCANGVLPVLQSAKLRGPLSTGNWTWTNPWIQTKPYTQRVAAEIEDTLPVGHEHTVRLNKYVDGILERSLAMEMASQSSREDCRTMEEAKAEDWCHPSPDMLFTRSFVKKWAARYGLGHLSDKEALRQCKAVADRELIAVDSVKGEIIKLVKQEDNRRQARAAAHDFMENIEDESPAASSVSILRQPQQGAIITNDYETTSRPDQKAQGIMERKGKKRRRDGDWLKGTHNSKHARWEGSPISSPTPLPADLPRQQEVRSSSLSQHAQEHAHDIASLRNDLRPVTPMRQIKNSSKRGKVLQRPYSDKGGRSKSLQEDLLMPVEGDPSNMDELLDNSQGPATIAACSSVEASQDLHSGADSSFSDLEEDGLVVITQSSNVNNWCREKQGMRCKIPTAAKLSKHQADLEHIDEDSFVTEVAPSSRNVETFRFRKRKRHLSDESESELLPDYNTDPITSTSNVSTAQQESGSKSSEFGRASEQATPATRKKAVEHGVKRITQTIPPGNSMRPAPNMMDDMVYSLSGVHKQSNTVERTGRIEKFNGAFHRSSPPGSPPACIDHSSFAHITQPPLQTSSTKSFLVDGLDPSMPHCSNDTQSSTLQVSIAMRQDHLKDNLMGSRLPRFEWEQDPQVEMQRIQMALSQTCRGSPQSMDNDIEFQVYKLPEAHKLRSELSHSTTPISAASPLNSNTSCSQDGAECVVKEAMISATSPASHTPQPAFPEMLVDTMCNKEAISHTIKTAALVTSKGEDSNVQLQGSIGERSQYHPTPPMPPVATRSSRLRSQTDKPSLSLDQNNISTQSLDTSPSMSQQCSTSVVDHSLIIETSMTHSRRRSSAEEPSSPRQTSLVTDDTTRRVDSSKTPFTEQRVLDVEQESLITKYSPAPVAILDLDVPPVKNVAPKSFTPVKMRIAPGQNLSGVLVNTNKTVIGNNNGLGLPPPDTQLTGPDDMRVSGPQSPWVAEPSQLLPLFPAHKANKETGSTVVSALISTSPNHHSPPIDDSEWSGIWRGTPNSKAFPLYGSMTTPVSSARSSKSNVKKRNISSEQTPDLVTKNPWASCLKIKSSGKSKKRVSFNILVDEDKTPHSAEQPSIGSPPPPDNPICDEVMVREDRPIFKHFESHFAAARRFTQILPDHVNSQHANSSPGLSAQAEAFIAADYRSSPLREHGAIPRGSSIRFLQPRRESSDNATWINQDEQLPFLVRPCKTPTRTTDATIPEFDMDEALAEIGGFLGSDWSVDTEVKNPVDSAQRGSSTSHGEREPRRRRLFGLA